MQKVTPEKIREAKEYGFDINPDTGEWSGICNVCNTYAVLVESCYCQSCINKSKEK